MDLTSISDKRCRNYEYYIQKHMRMVELNLNLIIYRNPLLLNSLDRSINHLFIRKYSINPFNFQYMYVLKKSDDYNVLTSCTNIDKQIVVTGVKFVLLSIPANFFKYSLS